MTKKYCSCPLYILWKDTNPIHFNFIKNNKLLLLKVTGFKIYATDLEKKIFHKRFENNISTTARQLFLVS